MPVEWRLSKPCSSAVSPHCHCSEHPAPSTRGLCTGELSLAAWSLLSLRTCGWLQTPGATFNDGRGQLSLPLGKDNSTPAELSFTYPTLYSLTSSLCVTFPHAYRYFLGSLPKSTACLQILLLGSASGENQTKAACNLPSKESSPSPTVCPLLLRSKHLLVHPWKKKCLLSLIRHKRKEIRRNHGYSGPKRGVQRGQFKGPDNKLYFRHIIWRCWQIREVQMSGS